MFVAATLSEVLAQNYIMDVFSFCLKSLILGGVGYMLVKFVDERKRK
jgi:hypothetical protein